MEFVRLDLQNPQHFAIIKQTENFLLPQKAPIPVGQRVRIEYEGAVYIGAVMDYFSTSSGSSAMGVSLEVEAGLAIKYFLTHKNPVVTCL